MKPILSVIMPVFNCAPYLAAAIDSVLGQNFTDFELILIDDGSTDDSLRILKSYAARDTRVRLLSRANKGLVYSLNEGIGLARGRYIARMDGDDIAVGDRFSCQVAYLETHPQVGILGGWGQLFGARNEIWHHRQDDNFIKVLLLFRTSGFQHSSVMARRAVFEQFQYSSEWTHLEDAALWCEIAARSSWRFHNLRKVLVHYRVHAHQVSERFRQEQDRKFIDLTLYYAKLLGLEIEQDTRLIAQIISKTMDCANDLERAGAWLRTLQVQLQQYMDDEFYVIQEIWLRLCLSVDAPLEVYHTKGPCSDTFHFLGQRNLRQ